MQQVFCSLLRMVDVNFKMGVPAPPAPCFRDSAPFSLCYYASPESVYTLNHKEYSAFLIRCERLLYIITKRQEEMGSRGKIGIPEG